jgi:enoyl-CoA hydratase/carnithine racemase
MHMRNDQELGPLHAEAPLVKRVQEGAIARVTLARPAQFNALSSALLAQLGDALGQIASDASVRVVVIAAEGKAFCAGHDLQEMLAMAEETRAPQQADPSPQALPAPQTPLPALATLFAHCSRLMMSIQRMPQPVIARVQGVATAAGCQLVAMCDLAVASQAACFAVSGVNLGLFCSTPSVALSRNLVRKQAFEMLVTGEFIDADQALARGLVNTVVPAEELDAAVDALCARILAKPAVAIAAGKELFYRQLEMGIEAAYQLAGQTMVCNMMADDTREGLSAFVEKRRPAWAAA